MRTYNRVAVHTAARISHNPYRFDRHQAPVKIRFRAIVFNKIKRVVKVVWIRVSSVRSVKSSVRRSTTNNKDDPHIVKRAA